MDERNRSCSGADKGRLDARHGLTRREALLGISAALLGLGLAGCSNRATGGGSAPALDGNASADGAPDGNAPLGERTLVAYFSHTGNTREAAFKIVERTGAEVFAIVPEVPYPDGMAGAASVAEAEHDENARPALADGVESMDGYDTVFLGYPIWYGTVPMVVATFVEQTDLAGKTVIPFCTSSGGSIDESVAYLRGILSDSEVLDGLRVTDDEGLDQWLSDLGY